MGKKILTLVNLHTVCLLKCSPYVSLTGSLLFTSSVFLTREEMSGTKHPLGYLTSIAGDMTMESTGLVFSVRKSHRPRVVVQFIQKSSFSYVY